MDPLQQVKALLFQMGRSRLPVGAGDASWAVFWGHNASLRDICEALSNADLKYVRGENGINFANVVCVVASKIVALASARNIRLQDWPRTELLAAVRILTRLLPFVMELGLQEPARAHFENVFWSLDASNLGSENAYLSSMLAQSGAVTSTTEDTLETRFHTLVYDRVPLGASLVRALVNLLFTLGFGVYDNTPYNEIWANDIQLVLWEPGISESACYSKTSSVCDSHRLEIMRLLLVLCSGQMYTSLDAAVTTGSKFLTVLTTSMDKRTFACLIASLINLTCKSTKDNDSNTPNVNGLEFDDQTNKKLRLAMVTNAIQLLAVVITYPLPPGDRVWLRRLNINESARAKNMARLMCAQISKSHELELVVKNLVHPLLKPLISQNQSMFSLTSNSYHIWFMELLVIILELFQCNPRFRYMLASLVNARIHFLMLYHILKLRNDDRHLNFVRMCANFLLLLTTEEVNASCLLKEIDFKYYNLMPMFFKLDFKDTILTNRDFLVVHICKLLMSDDCQPVLQQPMVHILFNLIPLQTTLSNSGDAVLSMRKLTIKDNFIRGPATQISLQASVAIIQLVSKFSLRADLYSGSEVNLNLLALILKSICQAVVKSPYDSIILIYAIAKHHQVFYKVFQTVRKISDQALNERLNLEKTQELDFTLAANMDDPMNNLRTPPPISQAIPTARSQTSLATANNTPILSPVDFLPPLSRQSTMDSRKSDYDDRCSNKQNQDDLARMECSIYQNDDPELFTPRMPVGMSENALAKRAVYDRLEDRWVGRPAIRIILKLAKLTNDEFHFNTNTSDISISIHKMNKFDVQRLTKQVSVEDEAHSPIRLHWTKESIGWELSSLWGLVFLNYSVYSTKSIFEDIGSSIKRATSSSFWGSFSWSKKSAAGSTETESPPDLGDFAVAENLGGSLVPVSLWLGTNLELFRVNPRILRDHYSFSASHLNSPAPSSVEGFWRRQSVVRQGSFEAQRRKGRDSIDTVLRVTR